jgi:prevent-host-death family protein
LTCGIREAKSCLSQLLEEVRQGAEIVITDRGRPVGKLVGVEQSDFSVEDRLARLVQRRCLEPENASSTSALPPALPMADSVAQSYLQADRER